MIKNGLENKNDTINEKKKDNNNLKINYRQPNKFAEFVVTMIFNRESNFDLDIEKSFFKPKNLTIS